MPVQPIFLFGSSSSSGGGFLDFPRSKTLLADYTIPAGYFDIWIQMRIPNTVTLRIEQTGTLRVLG